MYRTGIILERAFGKQITKQLPYILMVAGTDANVYLKDERYKEVKTIF